MIRLLELCKQLCSGSKSVKGNPGKWNETPKYYTFLSHCFLQKGSTSEAKNLAVEKHTFLRKSTKKYSVLVISSFQIIFQWYKSTCSNFISTSGKMSEPSSNSTSIFIFFFCPKILIQYHTAIFLICFLICGCTTHALYILIFVSVCICFNTEKL